MRKIVMIVAALSIAGSGAAYAASHHGKHAPAKPPTKEAPAKPAATK